MDRDLTIQEQQQAEEGSLWTLLETYKQSITSNQERNFHDDGLNFR